MRNIVSTLIIFITVALNTNAQQNTVASGGLATGTGGNISFSIGQIDYLYSTTASFSVSQGLQQVYNLNITAVRNNFVEDDRYINIYPNPTREGVYLDFEKFYEATYTIYDYTGNIVASNTIESSKTFIPLQTLPAATYIILITQSNKPQKSYLISKI